MLVLGIALQCGVQKLYVKKLAAVLVARDRKITEKQEKQVKSVFIVMAGEIRVL